MLKLKKLRLTKVLRPQQEFKSREVGNVFEIEEDRLVALAGTPRAQHGQWGVANPAASPMGPKFIALFEEAE